MFCPFLSSSEHSGVPEDSKSPTFPSVGLHPHTWPKWGCDSQSGVATLELWDGTNKSDKQFIHSLGFVSNQPQVG